MDRKFTFFFFFFLLLFLHHLSTIPVTKANQQHKVTESQNHRMLGVGRDLCGSSSPTPLPKQGLLQQACSRFSKYKNFPPCIT